MPTFSSGTFRPDRPTGTPAVPSGPDGPRPVQPESVALGHVRDPRTKANMEAKAGALAPRRWRPPTEPTA